MGKNYLSKAMALLCVMAVSSFSMEADAKKNKNNNKNKSQSSSSSNPDHAWASNAGNNNKNKNNNKNNNNKNGGSNGSGNGHNRSGGGRNRGGQQAVAQTATNRLNKLSTKADNALANGQINQAQRDRIANREAALQDAIESAQADGKITKAERNAIKRARQALAKNVNNAIKKGAGAGAGTDTGGDDGAGGEAACPDCPVDEGSSGGYAEGESFSVDGDGNVVFSGDGNTVSNSNVYNYAASNMLEATIDALDSVKEYSYRLGMSHGRYLDGILLAKIPQDVAIVINQRLESVSAKISDAYADGAISVSEDNSIIEEIEKVEILIANVWSGNCSVDSTGKEIVCAEAAAPVASTGTTTSNVDLTKAAVVQ